MLRFRFNVTRQQQVNGSLLFLSPFNMELNRSVYRESLADLVVATLLEGK